ncbi:MAG: hypothetical protein K0R57_4555 [Paenibacillaceae bacterium]|jgi:hypothetical protein|nr:hypothetical protein [Paenibacillaceae bacterium]
MYERKILLADGLKHHKYNWPKTLLTYRIAASEANIQNYHLIDDNRQAIPFQLGGYDHADGTVQLSLLADLPCGGQRSFEWVEGAPTHDSAYGMTLTETDGGIAVNSREIRLHVRKSTERTEDGRYPILNIESARGGREGAGSLLTDRELVSYEAELLEQGPLKTVIAVLMTFGDGSSYKLTLTVAEEMEFVELKEEMEGFPPSSTSSSIPSSDRFVVQWKQFDPQTRYARFRNVEKVDQYCDGQGFLPFTLQSYASAVSWWSVKTASFIDERSGQCIGVFAKDAADWRGSRYSIWGWPKELEVQFRYDPAAEQGRRLTWEYPLTDGCRSTAVAFYDYSKENSQEQKSYADYLWLWHEFISLDKVKDWVLRWEEDQNAYPRFFPEESIPEAGLDVWHYGIRKEAFTPAFMEEIVYHLSHNMNHMDQAQPVPAREFFSWMYVFDMSAPAMTQEQFDDFKACCAFIAYTHADENLLPTGHMLAGHPNFLADARSVPALMASLFPTHPDARLWKDQFERAMALNMKYHIRPEVKAWGSKAGRWTENLGCYNFAALVPMQKTAALLDRSFGDKVLLNPRLRDWAGWMLHSLSAPIDGRRTYPPQGAHSGNWQDPITPPIYVRMLAEQLHLYDPLLSEYLLYVCPPDSQSFEARRKDADIYKSLLQKEFLGNRGTRPALSSAKYTGHGFILRSSVGEESEVSVHLQQIDEGPNYRWGRAGQGGCGTLHLCASGRRYSYNRPEDVGDQNMGDVQNSCNFGVLVGHEYRSVGRNELTGALYDFGFAQYAKVYAGDYSRPFYQSRSVILSGHDYITVYDQVGDMRVRGRFSWFVKEAEPFPAIAQIKPGAAAVYVEPGIAIDVSQAGGANAVKHQSKGVHFDGFGDFLTIVSPRTLNADYCSYTYKTAYGAQVKLEGRTDLIFRDGSLIRHKEEQACFTGYAGIVRLYGTSKAEAALFEGSRIGALGFEVELKPAADRGGFPQAGIGFTVSQGRLAGKAICSEPVWVTVRTPAQAGANGARKLYVNAAKHEWEPADGGSIRFLLPEGEHEWEWTERLPVPAKTEVLQTVAASGKADVHWRAAAGAEGYRVEISRDCGRSWSRTAVVNGEHSTSYALDGLENGVKLHVRIQSFHADGAAAWSHDYPVYITAAPPSPVEGLKVWKSGAGYSIVWGKQLGCGAYKLYRRAKRPGEEYALIYEGSAAEYWDSPEAADSDSSAAQWYEYAASAVNGNGEGGMSLPRDTSPDGPAYWDPEPESGFRRYTRSHEFGYNGFDHWTNKTKPELIYPR